MTNTSILAPQSFTIFTHTIKFLLCASSIALPTRYLHWNDPQASKLSMSKTEIVSLNTHMHAREHTHTHIIPPSLVPIQVNDTTQPPSQPSEKLAFHSIPHPNSYHVLWILPT